MKRLVLPLALILTACNSSLDVEKEAQAILQTDRDFAMLSVKSGAAEVAASGDLGYSWGTSTGTSRETGQQAFRGKYMTVWKKDADGNWKFIADLGNSSPAASAQGMQ